MEVAKKRILFVDDDSKYLSQLEDMMDQNKYEVFTAQGGEKAIAFLQQQPVDLMITELRLTKISGYKLLEAAKKFFPEILRLILTTRDQERELRKAMQHNLAKMYLFKPAKQEMIMRVIEQMFQFQEMLSTNELTKIIDKVDELPVLSNIYQELCEKMELQADLKEIADIIQRDQSITAQILRVANSVFFQAKTGSVQTAISYLGLGNVKDIVLSMTAFNQLDHSIGAFEKKIMWKHAERTNQMVGMIYKFALKKSLPGLYMVAGLLHDIGKVVSAKYFNEEYTNIKISVTQERTKTIAEVEYERWGVSHQEIGAYLLNWWGLPQPIIEAAAFHHRPMDERIFHKEIVAVTHLADYFAWHNTGNQAPQYLDQGVFELLGITREQCEKLVPLLQDT